ncbi:nucleoside-diphosphate kinase [Patescibacteria group bacterium]|nr:nucleoside-diphosphate kinase [Patescibacteria group bacterium]
MSTQKKASPTKRSVAVSPKEEMTLVIIKPDGVKRGLIGEIINRIERRGLKIVGLQMFQANKKDFDKHYANDKEYLTSIGNKTLSTYAEYGYDAMKELGTKDPLVIGKMVREWLLDFMTSGPVVKIAVQGVHAPAMVRKIVGSTMPSAAEMGTIRGDFSVDSAAAANRGKRAVHNLIHASGNPQEAKFELGLWFNKKELFLYSRAEEDIMF